MHTHTHTRTQAQDNLLKQRLPLFAPPVPSGSTRRFNPNQPTDSTQMQKHGLMAAGAPAVQPEENSQWPGHTFDMCCLLWFRIRGALWPLAPTPAQVTLLRLP